MKTINLFDGENYIKENIFKRRWRSALLVMSALVLIITVYVLMLPAVTMEKQCGMEEHTHSEECCVTEQANVLVCSAEDLNIHEHTDDCYDDEGDIICGYADFIIHTHDENCYDEDGELCCDLPEIEEHEHDEDCYEEVPLHTHDDDCFTEEQGDLICEDESEEHEHDDDCYEQNKVLTCEEDDEETETVMVCEEEEIVYHEHDEDECYDEDGNLICDKIVVRAHQHTEECFELRDVEKAVCGYEEHTHTSSCEKKADESAGESGEETGNETEAPQYICGKDVHEHDENCYDAEGVMICEIEEHSHTTECEEAEETSGQPVENQPTEEQLAAEEQFVKEIEVLEAIDELTEEDRNAAEELLTRLEESYLGEEITVDAYTELYSRISALLQNGNEAAAESIEGTNWIKLRDSGWFEEYSEYAVTPQRALMSLRSVAESAPSSEQQINDKGGGNTTDDGVKVSKTIAGTDLENVFDITLQVETPQKIEDIASEPDMAVVIVMDISNTMNDNFGGVTRYAAAMESAEDFLDKFAESNSLGASKIGYVAFNTNAHEIFGLTSCTNLTQANSLKNTMRTKTGSIINAFGYGSSHDRFTNVEAGLKMASDMLDGVSNKNKFIIFLSDGFPTTYVSDGYNGYDPYDSTGRFFDHVLKKNCLYGTSYSDEASIRARNMAASIKNSGTQIFSIGVDVAGQTIQEYITSSEKSNGFSLVDRESTTYEIGDASSTEAYKSWLRNSIGSGVGYYYDSTNTAGLKDAYDKIFEQIKITTEESSKADWVVADPIPTIDNGAVEFIQFYDKTGELAGKDLEGAHNQYGENTANYSTYDYSINWDLKESGYTTIQSENVTTYTYMLKYSVRLMTEKNGFIENNVYATNGDANLTYRVINTVNGVSTVSEAKKVKFPVPSVHGFLGELTFEKVDDQGNKLLGAEFTLKHDDENCRICRGDGSHVNVPDQVKVSGEDGNVTFTNIPSGHKYTLTETKVPDGYSLSGYKYYVTVAYGEVTVTVTDSSGNLVLYAWNNETGSNQIVNNTYYELPQTGGIGTTPYTAAGILLITSAAVLLCYRNNKCKTKKSASK